MMQRNKKRRRFKKAVKVTLVVFAVCGIVFIIWLVRFLTAKPTIKTNYLDQYNQVSRPENYSEAENAWPLYQKALAAYNKLPEYLPGELQWVSGLAELWPREMDSNSLEFMRGWLASNEEAFHYASLAAAKPYYWVALTPGETPLGRGLRDGFDSQALRQFLGTAMTAQAIFYAYEGLPKKAFAQLQDSYTLGLQFAGNKGLAEQLIICMSRTSKVYSAARIILSRSEVDRETLHKFQTFLEERQPPPLTFWSEKSVLLYYTQKMFTDNGRGNGHVILKEYLSLFEPQYDPHPRRSRKLMQFHAPGKSEALDVKLKHMWKYAKYARKAITHDDRKETIEKIDSLHRLLEELVLQTPYELHAQGTTYEEQIQNAVGTGQELFLKMMTRSDYKTIEGFHEDNSHYPAILAILASTRYKVAEGDFPESLDDLVSSGYLKGLPQDPYSDGPLIYRKAEDGFILYSVGANFKDDGGKRVKRYGWYAPKGGDIVFWPVARPDDPQQTDDDDEMYKMEMI